MCFVFIPNSSQIHPYFSSHPTLYPFLKNLQAQCVLLKYPWIPGLQLEHGNLSETTPLEKRLYSLGCQPLPFFSTARSGWYCVSIFPLHAGTWSGLTSQRSCVCCHSFCEIMCALALLYPENNASLSLSSTTGSSTLLAFSSTMIPELWGWGAGHGGGAVFTLLMLCSQTWFGLASGMFLPRKMNEDASNCLSLPKQFVLISKEDKISTLHPIRQVSIRMK